MHNSAHEKPRFEFLITVAYRFLLSFCSLYISSPHPTYPQRPPYRACAGGTLAGRGRGGLLRIRVRVFLQRAVAVGRGGGAAVNGPHVVSRNACASPSPQPETELRSADASCSPHCGPEPSRTHPALWSTRGRSGLTDARAMPLGSDQPQRRRRGRRSVKQRVVDSR